MLIVFLEFDNCKSALEELKTTAPGIYKYTILNLDYYLFESLFYLTIVIANSDNKFVNCGISLIQVISIGFMIYGLTMLNSAPFIKFDNLAKSDD